MTGIVYVVLQKFQGAKFNGFYFLKSYHTETILYYK